MPIKHVILFTISVVFSLSSFAHKLKTGDILLQPLKCWACTLIEEQENSLYSHIGVYLNINGKDMVAEAYGKVQLVSLDTFLKKTQTGLKVEVKRHYQHKNFNNSFIQNINRYVGNPYDHYFLWDNVIKGKELIYCSELLYKAMLPFVSFDDLAPKEMLFDINPKLWDRYFRGMTPRNKPGISPEDFNLSSDFYFIQKL